MIKKAIKNLLKNDKCKNLAANLIKIFATVMY